MNERTHTSKERPQEIPTRQHTPTIQQHSEKDARGIGNAVGKGGKFNGRHIVPSDSIGKLWKEPLLFH